MSKHIPESSILGAFTARPWLVALALATPVALSVLTLSARHGFDGLYGQDPYAYFSYAAGPLRESLARLHPPPPFFWPPGFPLLVALAMLVLGPLPVAGQLVSLVAGCAVPGLTYLLARELRPLGFAPERAGEVATRKLPDAVESLALLAGLLAALVPQLHQSSAVIMSDTTALAAATAGALALARLVRSDDRSGGLSWLLLAAGLTAFAVLARWAYALVAFPFTGLALWSLAQRPLRRALAQGAAASMVVAVVLLPVLGSGLRALVTEGAEHEGFLGDLLVYSWHPGNALQRSFETADGRLEHPTSNGLFYLSAPARRAFFTPAIAPLLIPGLWLVLRRRNGPSVVLLVLWPAVIFGFHAGAPWQNFRFNLAHLPPLAILTAAGAVGLARSAPRFARWLLVGWLVVGMSWMGWEALRLTGSFMERKADSLETARWVDDSIPPGAILLSFQLTLTIDHYTDRQPHELFLLDPPQLDALLSRSKPAYLLVDVESMAGQWHDAAPGLCYRWLRDGPGLELVGRRGAYSLFAVDAASER